MKAGIIVLGVGAAIAALAGGSSTANAAPPTPPKPDEPPTPPKLDEPPTPPKADTDFLPGTTTLASHVRKIDASTPTPSAFALKYAGDANRWKEIADANPVGTVYPGSPAIQVVSWYQLDTDADGNTLSTGKNVSGLQPWILGQMVKLPDSWLK